MLDQNQDERMSLPNEFEAVVLAGMGSKMYPLTEDIPKALLPIANQPLISNALKFLEKSNSYLSQVYICCFPSSKQRIASYIEQYESSLSITVMEVPEDYGSAEALATFKPVIKSDFIVISGDLVTDMSPNLLVNTYRALNPSMTALFFDAALLESGERLNKEEGEIVGIDDKTSKLVFSVPRADVIDDQIHLKRSLLSKFPTVHFHSQLRDAHLYIFKHWVLDLVVNKALVSIKNDLVPLLLECQHRKTLVESLGISALQQDHQPDLFKKARMYSLSQTNTLPQVSCYAIVQRQGFTARANTVWSFAEINRTLVKNMPNDKVPDTTEVSPKTQIGNDSLVGHSTNIGERCSVKRTVVGNHVKIGKGCKLINCVVMDYVVLEDGYLKFDSSVKLDNTIVCKGAKVSAKSELKDCEVASEYVVAPETHAKGEHLIKFMVDE